MDDFRTSLRGKKYLSLESFRQDGTGAATPVWFVLENGRLFCRSDAAAHKVRRIRRNPSVTVAPCTFKGDLKGTRVPARVEMVPESEWPRLHGLYLRKYPIAYGLWPGRKRGSPIFFELVPEERLGTAVAAGS